MTLIWDGKSLPIKANYWEWGGTGDGTPPLSDRVKEAASFGSGAAKILPPNGCDVLQQIQTANGDVYSGSTGWRTLTRQGDPIPLRSIGFDSNIVIAVWTPKGYPGDAGMFVCPLEYHHTSPNGVTGVVPAALTMDQNGARMRLWGGTENSSGAKGNPGHTVTFDNNNNPYPATERDVWHVWLMRLKYGFKDNQNVNLRGAVDIYHGIVGTDTEMVSLTSLTNINCGYGTLKYYPLIGLYRAQSGTSTTTIYLAGMREYDDTTEALAWATTLLGDVTAPPPPNPTQIPYIGNWTTGKFVDSHTIGTGPASSSFQGPWTNAVVVHAYNPAPSSAFEGSWTTAKFVSTFPPVGSSPVATLSPTITGSLTVDQTLTCSTGTWNGNPTSFHYLWQTAAHGTQSWSPGDLSGPGTTDPTRLLTPADAGLDVKCMVGATNTVGTGWTNSNIVGPIAAVGAPPDTTPPTAPGPISLTSAVTAASISLGWQPATDAGGISGYELERSVGGAPFALRQTVTATSAVDGGLSPSTDYSYRVRAFDGAGNLSGYSATFTATTGSGAPPPAVPSNTGLPAVTGTLIEGQTLTSSAGTWTNNPTSFLYYWQRSVTGNPNNIFWSAIQPGSAENTYVLDAADVGMFIRCGETASNATGTSTPVPSNTVGPIIAAVGAPPDTTPPSDPGPMFGTAPPTQTTVSLGWGAATDAGGVTSYEVERYQSPDWVLIATVTGTTMVDSGLTPGTMYTYRVRASDAAGNQSGYTVPTSISTASGTQTTTSPVATSSPAITGSVVNGQTLTCSTGTWNGNPTSFSYAWSSAPTGTQVFTLLISSSSPSYLLTAAEVNRDIRCAVGATNTIGTGVTLSNIVGPVVAAAPPPDTTPPSAPTVLAATAVDDTTISLTWVASFDARGVTGYQVERAQGAGTFARLVTVTSTNVTNAGVTPGISYSYRVRAFDAAGNLSAYSNTATATTTAVSAPPDADTDRILILTPV